MISKRYLVILLAILLALGVIISGFFVYTWFAIPKYGSCSTVNYLNASLDVRSVDRKLVGLNTDTDSLAFGVVSAGASIKRLVFTKYSKEAIVQVNFEGDFKEWLMIEPAQFKIKNGTTEEVFFTVNVPKNSSEGNYTGQVKFCFKE